MKKFATVLMLVSISSLFASPSTPPMPPSFGVKSDKPYPESCKSLPKMIVFLPPPMEVDFIKCKNDLNMPTVDEAKEALEIKFGKGVDKVAVSLAEGFHQLYKVEFQLNKESKTVFVNGTLTKFINGSLFDFVEERAIPTPKLEDVKKSNGDEK